MSAISPADGGRVVHRRARARATRAGLPARAFGLGLGVALDRVVGDPRRLHPVAGFGRVAQALERRLLDTNRSVAGQHAAGLMFTGLLVGGTATAGLAVDRLLARSTAGTVAWNAVVVWSCLGGTSLLRIARRQDELLSSGDADGSRELLPWLCGRDPAALDADDLARAVVESVAENTSDAAVCTLVWAAVAGPTGAVAHRAANTLDAMVGHRSARYQYFGTASARLDDALGYLPARLAGLLGIGVAATIGGSPSGASRAWRSDAHAHPSPNAGVVESVCAGALGVRLGGPTPYPYGVQQRALLGDGRQVTAGDIGRAVRLHDRVQLAAAGLMITGLLLAGSAAAGSGPDGAGPPERRPSARWAARGRPVRRDG